MADEPTLEGVTLAHPEYTIRGMQAQIHSALRNLSFALINNDALDKVPVYGLTLDKEDRETLIEILNILEEIGTKYAKKVKEPLEAFEMFDENDIVESDL